MLLFRTRGSPMTRRLYQPKNVNLNSYQYANNASEQTRRPTDLSLLQHLAMSLALPASTVSPLSTSRLLILNRRTPRRR